MQRDPDVLELIGVLATAVSRLAQAVDDLNPYAFNAPLDSLLQAEMVLRRLEQMKEAMGDG